MTSFNRGDVVIVDLGYVGKTRPCVALSDPRADSERNITIVVPLTTEIRGGKCEVAFDKPFWLREKSVVNVLGIVGIDNARITRKIARFPETKLTEIYSRLNTALGQQPNIQSEIQ